MRQRVHNSRLINGSDNPRLCKRYDFIRFHIYISFYSFNPRICKRCDQSGILFQKHFQVSIHASVKDATGRTMEMYNQISVSIHASVKDATSHGVRVCRILPVSIHASVKDATLNLPKQIPFLKSFNPRICKRCDK